MSAVGPGLPAPTPDQLSEPFWAALADHRVVVQA